MKISDIQSDMKTVSKVRATLQLLQAPDLDLPVMTWRISEFAEMNEIARRAAFSVLKGDYTAASFRQAVIGKLEAKLAQLESKYPFTIEEG